jgi:transposase
MRLKGWAEVLERRRRRALQLLDEGLSLHEVSRRIDCSPTSVLRWQRARERGGEEGLKVRFSPGRPPKLDRRQQQKLLRLLPQGAPAHGYRTDLWTTARMAEVIQKHFRVRYHRDHVGRLLHALGWSPQKPERRARERDERAIERWKREVWPRVKKTPRGWAPTLSSRTNRASS